jgi:hypothetical protein
MTITPEQIAQWRRKRGNGMTSAVGEYTPSEFWDALDEIERLRDELDDEQIMNDGRLEVLRATEREVALLRNLLRYLAASGVEQDDERLRYVTVQIDRATWDAVRAA